MPTASITRTGLGPLEAADRPWLERLISRRVSLAQAHDALTRRPGDVKVIIDLPAAG
jgi:hypothetical protein